MLKLTHKHEGNILAEAKHMRQFILVYSSFPNMSQIFLLSHKLHMLMQVNSSRIYFKAAILVPILPLVLSIGPLSYFILQYAGYSFSSRSFNVKQKNTPQADFIYTSAMGHIGIVYVQLGNNYSTISSHIRVSGNAMTISTKSSFQSKSSCANNA